ncbi:hypothetical protein [Streptomyces sp. NBRC 110035]|uniref:hypothetical protein n=1 Tax=Streptomyces sp. NBRC 110035 TaxID=1547867 RepID=UPI0018FE34E6|nr:hypothetical protein [Streptomyces sp. NBRC 110035]
MFSRIAVRSRASLLVLTQPARRIPVRALGGVWEEASADGAVRRVSPRWSMAGGAHEELARYGQLGDLGLELLRRVGRQVARSQGFPPAEGHVAWTDEAVDELLFEMIGRKGENFLLTCFPKTVDDASLEKMFFTSIRNFLIDEAKRTERRKLRRRFAARLGARRTGFARCLVLRPGGP